MAAQQKSPKTVTIYGRLSFPTFSAQAAFEKSQKGKYPAADVASAAPDFNLLVEKPQLDKLVGHIKTTFLPYCVQQEASGEKRDVLTKKEAADLLKQVESLDASGVYNTPVKAVHDKTSALAPEAVAQVKVIGNRGVDIEQRAIVTDENELLVPEPDLLTFPVVRPIHQTVHSMYPGCYVAATLNLYAYHNGKLPGFSAGASVAVFKADGDRIGGGVVLDESEIFED